MPKPTPPKANGDIVDRTLHHFEGQRWGVLRAGWYYDTAKNTYFYVTGFPIVRNVKPLWENTTEAVLGLTPLKSSSGAPEGGERKATANLDHKVSDTLKAVDDFVDNTKDQGIGLVKTAKDTAIDLAYHPSKIPATTVSTVKGVAGYTYNTTTGVISGTYNYTTGTIGSIIHRVTGLGGQAKDKATEAASQAKAQAQAVANDPKGHVDKAAGAVKNTLGNAKKDAFKNDHPEQAVDKAAGILKQGVDAASNATAQAQRQAKGAKQSLDGAYQETQANVHKARQTTTE